MIIELGNIAPLHPGAPETTVTTVHLPEDTSLYEMLQIVASPQGLWVQHSSEPPAWVESSNPMVAAVLRENYKTGSRPADGT